MLDIESITNQIINADCMDILKQLPDKCIDLVLTDPPYGINIGEEKEHNGWRAFGKQEWDKKRPSKDLFKQLLRVSKNQIIWGGNYFSDYLPNSQCWLVWNKGQRNFSLADGELAYTSFDKALRIFDYTRAKQLNTEIREHPTQKPLKLFEWCIKNFSKENDLILDCFSGSGTTAIACHNLKRRFICIEKDYDYWKASVERLKNAQAQLKLF
jgi:site-specific DNA-methyltransferase (adenine-specific)